VFLYAFDLIELNGDDMRRDQFEVRKATLASVLTKAGPGIRFNEHIEGDGPTVFAHACKLGLEGIVSKRKDSTYRSGRSPDWLKMKNADAPAVKRKEEEDWGKRGEDDHIQDSVPPVTRMRTIETLLTGCLIDGRALTRRSLIDATIASPRGTQCFPNTGSGKQ